MDQHLKGNNFYKCLSHAWTVFSTFFVEKSVKKLLLSDWRHIQMPGNTRQVKDSLPNASLFFYSNQLILHLEPLRASQCGKLSPQ